MTATALGEVTWLPERATNVVDAINRVLADLPGIGRDSRASQQQGGYAYRGIEAITKEAAPLFAKHGVVFVPHVLSWERDEVTVGGKPWTDDRMTISYTVYGPGGAADCIEVGPIPAVGRDNSDKGANKCMTQAFKYALLQVLCIADGKDDGDRYTEEAEYGGRVDRATGEVTAVATEDIGAMKPRELHDALAVRGLEQGGTLEAMRTRLYEWSRTAAAAGEPVTTSGDDTAPDVARSSQSSVEPVAASPAAVSDVGTGELLPLAGSHAEVPGEADVREDSDRVERSDDTALANEGTSPGTVEGEGYAGWTRADLMAECASRVPVIDTLSNATKPTLVEQLRAWDRRNAPDSTEWAERPY